MNTENYSRVDSSDNRVLSQIQELVYRRLDRTKYRLFLFGSRATGNTRAHSDYDIGITGDEPVDFNTLMCIRGDMEDVPALVDIVDFSTVSKSFRETALRDAVLLHPTPIQHTSDFKFERFSESENMRIQNRSLSLRDQESTLNSLLISPR